MPAIPGTDCNDIAAAEFAVDGEVEECQAEARKAHRKPKKKL